MGQHPVKEMAMAMLAAVKELMSQSPFDEKLAPLKTKLKSVEAELLVVIEQHQLEDEFRKIHDLPPTVTVKIPKGWGPTVGKILTRAQIEAMKPGPASEISGSAAKRKKSKKK